MRRRLFTPTRRSTGRATLVAAAGALAALGAGPSVAAATSPPPAAKAGQASCSLPAFGPGDGYRPRIRPKDFGPDVTNPYFPLKPGRTLVYTGTKDGKKALNLVLATSRTKVVDGIRARVVEDRLYLDNVLEERTSDYYAQDRCGNVWYFGEDTATLDRRGRVVSTEGSFLAGVKGAQPGVFMQASPQLGRRFRQEWLTGQAEDVFKAISLASPVSVPYGTFREALRTEETTALEPGVLDDKYYVKGVGQVVEKSIKGPREALQLIEIVS